LYEGGEGGARAESAKWWYFSAWVASLSILLLIGVSTTMRAFSMPYALLSEDLLLRLKPVIKGASTEASFVVFVGSCGNPFVERCRHGRGGRTRIRAAGGTLARYLRLSRFLRFHGFTPI
jgi:hypothetical protein